MITRTLMKAFVLPEAGGVENLLLQETERPRVARGEVLVKVRALSVNPADVKIRGGDALLTAFLGARRPALLGWDFAGEVSEVGEQTEGFRAGDGVFGVLPTNRAGGSRSTSPLRPPPPSPTNPSTSATKPPPLPRWLP